MVDQTQAHGKQYNQIACSDSNRSIFLQETIPVPHSVTENRDLKCTLTYIHSTLEFLTERLNCLIVFFLIYFIL